MKQMNLLSFTIGYPEILIILVVGVVLFLPSILMLLMGRPIQSLLCLALQCTILGYPAAVIWVILVYLNDRAEKRMDSHPANQNWKIHPFVGVGSIYFGQPRSDVIAMLGTPFKSYRKVPFAPTDTDSYRAIGLHIYYDPEYRVEGIDANDPSTISLNGISFLNRSVEEVVDDLARLGFKSQSLIFEDAGVALFEEDGIVKSVNIFPRGAHDLSDPNSVASRANAALAAWRTRKE
jgi:hypothetical protein